MIKVINLSETENKRWQVVFEEGNWLAGAYRPEFRNREEISTLERHDAPELFLLIEGEITLVLMEGDEIKELPLKKGTLVIVDCWHNAYSPDGKGLALVIEKTGVKTEFLEVRSER